MSDLYINLSWCVWHEGVPLFDDSDPGSLRPEEAFRAECIVVQDHNQGAKSMINATPPAVLRSLMSEAHQRIPNEHNVRDNMRWVLYHEDRVAEFRAWKNARDFFRIRQTYCTVQSHNPNVRNLLAAMSNGDLVSLIDTL